MPEWKVLTIYNYQEGPTCFTAMHETDGLRLFRLFTDGKDRTFMDETSNYLITEHDLNFSEAVF